MSNNTHSIVLLVAALATLGTVQACESSRTDRYQMDSAAGVVVDQGEWVRDSMLTDGSIMGALEEANEAEVDASELAKSRASDSEVRAYALAMIADHEMMEKRSDSLARALNINVIEPPDVMEDMNEKDLDSLKRINKDTSSAASTFDRAYIEHQIRAHKHVLTMVDMAIERAQNSQLKTVLQNDVRPAVSSHLQRAEAIQRRIGSMTAGVYVR